MSDRRRITINDVAEQAGVSRTTVSVALNGKGNLSAATIERVRSVAEELGYQPNAVARGLRQSRLGVISLVIRPLDTLDTANPEGVDYFLRFAGTAALAAVDRGSSLMLAADPSREGAAPSALATDGFIIDTPLADDPLLHLLDRRGIPYVISGVGPDVAAGRTAVTQDVVHDTESVLNLLADSGATRVCLVTGSDPNDWNRLATSTYRSWAQERGMTPEVHVLDETSGVAGGRSLGLELLSRPDRPDALYCLTGRHSAGVGHAAAELGLRLPDDLQLVAGSDAVVTRTFSPPITAIDLNPEGNARIAISALSDLLDGVPVEWPLTGAPSQLHLRGSTRATGTTGTTGTTGPTSATT